MEAPSVFKLSSKFCSACNVSFDNDGIRRVHAKSQWHVENLRRRVVGLPPIDASEATSLSQTTEEIDVDHSTPPESNSDDEVESSDDASSGRRSPSFVPGQCLFCPEISQTVYDNLSHMQEGHGMFIPRIDDLIVDLETLVRYLFFVVHDYRECLYCHTQRRTVQAVQQHMAGKGHCKFDIDPPDSEFRDFYNLTTPTKGDDLETQPQRPQGNSSALSVQFDDDSALLPSGKTVTHRSTAQTGQGQRHRPNNSSVAAAQLDDSTPIPSSSETQDIGVDTASVEMGPSQALTKKEKRIETLGNQLANLRVGDRASLAHLQISEQRSLLATQKRQAEKAQRAERRHRRRVMMLTNRIEMEHYVIQTPVRSCG